MRLIEADRLCEDLMTRWSIADKNAEKTVQEVMTYVVTPIVVSQPTIDAVEVVRCKECKHWSEKACHKFLATHPSNADDFCSYGEREDE